MICYIIKTVLVILILRKDVNGNYLNLYGIPEIAEENSVFRLHCQRLDGGRLYSKVTVFQRNGSDFATMERRHFFWSSWCNLYVHNGESGYGCESSSRTRTLVIYKINKTRDSNTTWLCKNDNKRSNQYILPVKTDPPQCKLKTNIRYNRPSDQEVGDQLVLSEGDDLYLNCSASIVSGNHAKNEITYQWKIYGNKDEIRNGSVCVKPNITRLDGALYMCTASIGSYCSSSDGTYIQIQYPLSLNITVNDTTEVVELICRVVDGYPTNITINNWTHYIDGQFVREIEGVTTQDRTAVVLNNTILNEGSYVCNASNGIKDLKGTIHQTDEIYINIEAPPTLLEVSNVPETHVGSAVELTTTFIISGDVLNITWYQQQQNSSNITEISVNTTVEHGIRPVDIYGTVINKNVTIISGNVTVSKMVDLNVTVTVCTQYGCTESNQHVTVLPELSSSTVPFVTEKASTDGLISSNSELSENVPLIAGVVFVAAAVLIGLIILIIVLVRRRSNYNTKSAGTARQNPTNSFRYRNPTYDTIQDQPTNDQCLYGNDNLMKNQQNITDNQTMEILENDLYISADDDPTPNKVDHTHNNQMEIMENDPYISADDDTNLRGTGLQDGEMEIMENDLYISADDDKNTDGVETKPEMEIIENDLYIPLEIDTRVF